MSYDVETLGLQPVAMRIRVDRNLENFPLSAAMTRKERCALENQLFKTFELLMATPEYGGRYYSITPGHPAFVEGQHVVYNQNITVDANLTSAGIARDWPYGRGCYVSEDKSFIIWVGEEDHLRIMCTGKVTKLEKIFNRLKMALGMLSR